MCVWYEQGAHGSLPVDGRFGGIMNLGDVRLPEGAKYYLCGPLPFMRDIRSVLLDRGVRASDSQYEVFGPISGKRTPTEWGASRSPRNIWVSCGRGGPDQAPRSLLSWTTRRSATRLQY